MSRASAVMTVNLANLHDPECSGRPRRRWLRRRNGRNSSTLRRRTGEDPGRQLSARTREVPDA